MRMTLSTTPSPSARCPDRAASGGIWEDFLSFSHPARVFLRKWNPGIPGGGHPHSRADFGPGPRLVLGSSATRSEPRRGATNQPRASPWDSPSSRSRSPERAKQGRPPAALSPFQGSGNLCRPGFPGRCPGLVCSSLSGYPDLSSQGGALGWFVSALQATPRGVGNT